jgi:urease accessory protein
VHKTRVGHPALTSNLELTMPAVAYETVRIGHVLGSRLDPAFHDRIHALEHHGAVDLVIIPQADLARRRLLRTTRKGVELAIALPREQRLFDGAILALDESRAIIVRAETERWLRLKPRSIADAIELGYQAGNLHWRVRFDGEVLLVPLEGRPEDYAARLEDLLSSGRIEMSIVQEEAGAGAARGHQLHAHADHYHHRKGGD